MKRATIVVVIQTVMRRPAVLAGSNIQSADEIEALLDKETTQVFVDNVSNVGYCGGSEGIIGLFIIFILRVNYFSF